MSFNVKSSLSALSALGLFAVCSLPIAAFALPVSCSSGSGLECIANGGDVLAGGVTVSSSGNDFESIVEAALKSATGLDIDLDLYGKSDANPGLFSFSNFDSGSSLEDSKSGSWSTVDNTVIDYITVKAANSFILYSIGSSSGLYSTLGILNNGGRQPNVSHISFWTAPAGATVPEPASMLLLGSSLAGMGVLRRRRQAA